MDKRYEMIGNITLDLSNYKGSDVYSDGSIEDEILDIVKNNPADAFDRIIEDKASWPILYHLSGKRENIAEWLDIEKNHRVLEIGAGCGAITGVLSKKAGMVTCVDLSKKRSLINAYRHSDCDNVTIHVGNFADVEPGLPTDFDWIFLIGVFEYGQCYIDSDKPFHEFLRIISHHLKLGGKVVIAIENRLGLKYFAGAREDHLGSFFSGIENYNNENDVRTFSKPALERIFRETGFDEVSFYYPYPDYKFPTTIFSDRRLPKDGELVLNNLNFDRDRLTLFNEKKAYDSMIADGLFPVFSNSFLAVLGSRPETDYVRYSNDRAKEYAIKTEIRGGAVRKSALFAEGEDHIRRLETSCAKLKEKYEDSKLHVADVKITDSEPVGAEFEFIRGETLALKMDRCISLGDREGFEKLFKEFSKRIEGSSDVSFSDRDLVFSNIIIDGDRWSLIDYEWTVEENLSVRGQAARALYCYMLEREFECFGGADFFKELTGCDDDMIAAIKASEAVFQKKVTGDRLSLAEIRNLIGNGNVPIENFLSEIRQKNRTRRVQIYLDRGKGYSEADSFFVKNADFNGGTLDFVITFGADTVNLRIDPMMEPCIVMVEEISINRVPVNKKNLICNGKSLKKKNGWIFTDADPNMGISLKDFSLSDNNVLRARMHYAALTPETAAALSDNVKSLF